MIASSKCRLGLYIGLRAVSFAKAERKSGRWSMVDCGTYPWSTDRSSLETSEDELHSVLQQIIKEQGVQQEAAHVSLHSRYCITRIATTGKRAFNEQLAEIVENAQHYLQLGLGEKLIGQSVVSIDAHRQYGQVAIIKRGLIEVIEETLDQTGLELVSVDGAMTSVCRLAGLCRLDEASSLLIVRLGTGGSEIGISHQGRMQLNYQAGTARTVEETAETIRKHMKRIRRFCGRYRRSEDGGRGLQLNQVLILADAQQSRELKERLASFDFERVLTLQDLCENTELKQRLADHPIETPGVAFALGGLITHLEQNSFPPTDVYDKYLQSKPSSWWKTVFTEYGLVLAAASLFLAVLLGNWWIQNRIQQMDREFDILVSVASEEDTQTQHMNDAMNLLGECRNLARTVYRAPVAKLLTDVASCLPDDTRVDSLSVEENYHLVLKGTMREGDRSYEVLKALKSLPVIQEVSLESVGRSAKHGETGTLFEIHCELTAQSAESSDSKIASIEREGATG